MSAWMWLAVAVGAFLFLSIMVSLVVAAILGQIGRDVSDLLESAPSAAVDVAEFESWASAPLAREAIAKKQRMPAEDERLTRAAAPKTRIL
jgi:hypothetical protein